MRFNTPRPSDRIAAVMGTVLGAFFGVFGGLAILIAGVAGLVFWSQFSNPETPEEITQLYARYFQSETPSGLIPIRGAQAIKGQAFFVFADTKDSRNQSVLLYMFYSRATAQQLRTQIESNLKTRGLREIESSEPRETTNLIWQIFDTDVPVTKSVFCEQVDGIEVEFVQYYGVFRERLRTLGLSVTVKQPHPVFDEQRVKELFNSFQSAY